MISFLLSLFLSLSLNIYAIIKYTSNYNIAIYLPNCECIASWICATSNQSVKALINKEIEYLKRFLLNIRFISSEHYRISQDSLLRDRVCRGF